MKVEICSYSHYRIHPGHGKRYVRLDSRSFVFITRKAEKAFLNKCNPRRTRWTVIYRRMNKKGISEETSRKRNRKTKKFFRGVVGASAEVVRAKRNQAPELREAQRNAAIKEAKEKSRARKEALKAQGAAASQQKTFAKTVRAPKFMATSR
ncbi:50S ribosomal protein L24e [Fonticula alba]|uniref:50S ribosomal protein L24e n=1 Tax=Fonticula alba TaxID=691883 RepID=A0A058Z6Q5_FONAL|nr:50S ribosomal protein L24e [Fonticula alba]KCV69603.1 50S ribosomal protein L24e [Fonticula alba]|eukprot:XP_009496168.1 50S ribosomal protein L24e [Fonticula alba]